MYLKSTFCIFVSTKLINQTMLRPHRGIIYFIPDPSQKWRLVVINVVITDLKRKVIQP